MDRVVPGQTLSGTAVAAAAPGLYTVQAIDTSGGSRAIRISIARTVRNGAP